MGPDDILMNMGCREGQQDRIGLRGELVQAQFAAEASMPHANARSRTLMARLQARRFRQIYEYLAQVHCPAFVPLCHLLYGFHIAARSGSSANATAAAACYRS